MTSTYLVAFDVLTFCSEGDVNELLVLEKTAEEGRHARDVLVPTQAQFSVLHSNKKRGHIDKFEMFQTIISLINLIPHFLFEIAGAYSI